ncbi:Ribokinase-like protein [Punctularia strigosozonata HHB-11173 SS5]|uniref:Ribokinase-like protein n=1 Tax=Punctularia strigosozonata (strain HHB-11173) TaxID=741275 RepID=UPI0004417C73|nr:Ribokinase-like protein [Punctularia strigosozonata HHB-11173 SS5]EIN10681.1 Ribokinase-like protein [Punctularia strigosozonata HHB-11173 SS5]
MANDPPSPVELVSLGMFIIDTFSFTDSEGRPTGKVIPPQIGGGGVYGAIGARIWLPPQKLGMIIDRGNDFPQPIQAALDAYGPEMWLFRDNPDRGTTRSLNAYRGEQRTFSYLTPRIQITPSDLDNTRFAGAKMLHLICAPSRCGSIVSEIWQRPGWTPITIYEPVEYSCVPEELSPLIEVLPTISVLSPNASEALTLLSLPDPSRPSKDLVEKAASLFLEYGVGLKALAVGRHDGCVIIRAAEQGCYVKTRNQEGVWIDAYWTGQHADKVVDVTGAGNSFLGGLAAGFSLTDDIYEAALYATVSASFVVEQEGLPRLTTEGTYDEGLLPESWNGDSPMARLSLLKSRMGTRSRAQTQT